MRDPITQHLSSVDSWPPEPTARSKIGSNLFLLAGGGRSIKCAKGTRPAAGCRSARSRCRSAQAEDRESSHHRDRQSLHEPRSTLASGFSHETGNRTPEAGGTDLAIKLAENGQRFRPGEPDTNTVAAVEPAAITRIRIASCSSDKYISRQSARTAETTIEASSPQAVSLHQSQRSTRTIPNPAPSSRLTPQAVWSEDSSGAIAIAPARVPTLESRATQTDSRSEGTRWSSPRQRNRP